MALPKAFQTPSGHGFRTPSKLIPSRSALPQSPHMFLSTLAELPSSPLSRQAARTVKRRAPADKAGSESIASVRQRKQRGGHTASIPLPRPLHAIRGQSSPAPSSHSTRACASPFLPTPSSSSSPCTPKFNLLDNVVSSSPSHSRLSCHGLPGESDNEDVYTRERDSLLRKLVQAGLSTPHDNVSQTLGQLPANNSNCKTSSKKTFMPKLNPSLRSSSRPPVQPRARQPPNLAAGKDVFFTPPSCQSISDVLGSAHTVQGRRKRMKIESAPDGSAALVLSHDTHASERANLSRASRMDDPTSSPSPKPNTIGQRRWPAVPAAQHSSLVSAEVERFGRIIIKEDELIGTLGPEAAQKAICKAMCSKKRKRPAPARPSGKEAPGTTGTRSRIDKWLDLHDKEDDGAPVKSLAMPPAAEPPLPTRNLMDCFARLIKPPARDESTLSPVIGENDAQNLFWTCTGTAPLGESQQTALESIGQSSLSSVIAVAGESLGPCELAERGRDSCPGSSKLLDPALLGQQADINKENGSEVALVRTSSPDGCAGSQWFQYASHPGSTQNTLQQSSFEAAETISHVTQWTSDSERPSTPPLQQGYSHSPMVERGDMFGRSPRFGYAQTSPVQPIFKPGCNLNQSLLALAPSPTILLSGKTAEDDETENRPLTREGAQQTPSNRALRSCSRPTTFSGGPIKHDYSPRSPMRQRAASGRSVVQPLFWDAGSPGAGAGWIGVETDSWLSELDHNRDRGRVDEHALGSFLGIGQMQSELFLAGLEGGRGNGNENWFGSMSSSGGGLGGVGYEGLLVGQAGLGTHCGEQAPLSSAHTQSPVMLAASQQQPSQSLQPQGGVKYKNSPSFWI